MIFPSFIPKAQKLTKEEIDYPGLNDRVICGFFPVTAYLIILVVVFVTLIILELFGGYFENISFFRGVDWENVPVFRNILSIGGYGGIGLLVISVYVFDTRIVLSKGRIISITNIEGKKKRSLFFHIGVCLILLGSSLSKTERDDQKGIVILFAYIILVVLYVVMNATVISSVRQHKIDSRKKSCTYRVTAEFRRNIVNWNEKAAEDQRFRGIPEYIYCFEG